MNLHIILNSTQLGHVNPLMSVEAWSQGGPHPLYLSRHQELEVIMSFNPLFVVLLAGV